MLILGGGGGGGGGGAVGCHTTFSTKDYTMDLGVSSSTPMTQDTFV